jgi:cell division protease FtsH
MVMEFGMSRLGRIHYREGGGQAFLPNSPWNDDARSYSEQTAREIDEEVRGIINSATDEVLGVLKARRSALEAVASRLMDKEVIDGEELRQLLEDHMPRPLLVPGSVAVEKKILDDEDDEPDAVEPARRVEERG